jgi:AraC-like DNA-binding protein
MSYSQLVDAARFRAAGRLLKSDGARIIDVSLAVGYDDPSHFARAFKRIGGMSPRQFRRFSLQTAVA